MIRRYYDRNTNLFLTLGGSINTATIHRALWAPGLRKRAEALDTAHRLLAEQAARLGEGALHILDLGCGVGGSLFALSNRLPAGSTATGVTISPVQVEQARSGAERRGLAARLTFLEADFLALPPLTPVHLAYSIEAFVLTSDPSGYFRAVSRVLHPGGRLVIIDDFLLPHPGDYTAQESGCIAEFRAGWRAAGLDTVAAARDRAAQEGLRLVEIRDLTAWVRVDTWRDRMVALSVAIGRLLRLRGPYFDSLTGGDALRKCIAAHLTGYFILVFEKNNAHD